MPNIFPSPSADAVGVFDTSFRQVFPNGRPLKALVRENARSMEHPLENGQPITDYRVLLPVVVEVPMLVLPQFYRDTYQEIKNLYRNAQLLTVQTRSDIYQNMVIGEMPHEETPERFDVLTIILSFKQAIIISTQTQFAPADATQSSTVPLGQQNPVPVTAAPPAATAPAFSSGGGGGF